ncbi:uncharacterized protein C8R40DRAFT_1168952 [Lentinula edodes]|uniref:uncharacterized protein n=1 Tax=Lentinula edodes TaxID=5353 RepID=UPI001E8D9660|nr:uncharacterized protein C8R40DRAFT_1168952 [Lentinula edodes]KAH7877025.1 hypothetical protein C8R40DRAFT_1168952 [Lentinula edodes]
MLLLPPSLLRSLSVSVLIFPIILGVLAMPLASHATTPQLQLHDNPIRTRPLNLRRYNMGDKLLRNVPTKRPGCVLLLDYYERWVLVWGTKHLFRAQAHNGAWNIQTTDIDEQMSSGTLLGYVKFRSDDESQVLSAIANLPSQANQFLALQKVIEYLLGKYPVPRRPLPQDLQYQIYDENWCQIFSAMLNPIYETQWPNSPYLKLAPSVSRVDWRSENRNSKGNPYRPFVGTVVEDEVKRKFDSFGKFNSTLWDACQESSAP